MVECVLHLGSNLGFRDINIELAQVFIENSIGIISKRSYIYETSAWGVKDQNDFLNLALICHTSLSPQDVLNQILKIEKRLGRNRKEKWGPRLIDIDIIFYGEEIIKNDNLKIPHPELTNRNFVLIPLMDICANKVHPGIGKTILQLKEECQDHLPVTKANL